MRSEFREEPAQEVVGDSDVLLRSDDDYLFAITENVADDVFGPKAAHCGREATTGVPL